MDVSWLRVSISVLQLLPGYSYLSQDLLGYVSIAGGYLVNCICGARLLVYRWCVAPQWWGAADAEIKSHLLRTQSSNVLPATLTARDFFLAYFYLSSPFIYIFFQNLSLFFLYWLWLAHGSCVGPQNKIGHHARGRFPC